MIVVSGSIDGSLMGPVAVGVGGLVSVAIAAGGCVGNCSMVLLAAVHPSFSSKRMFLLIGKMSFRVSRVFIVLGECAPKSSSSISEALRSVMMHKSQQCNDRIRRFMINEVECERSDQNLKVVLERMN